MIVRSRSRVPPTTGTAMAARMNISATTTIMSIRAAPRASVTGRFLRLQRGHDNHRLELQEALLADALDVHQLLDLLESAVLGTVFDDALGRLPANARQGLELIDRGEVEI